MLIRLIYASTAKPGVDLTEFKKILLQAQTNNQRRDLTGMLAFNSTIFLQGLEGARDQVNELYSKLLHDNRHHLVTILGYREIEERQWSSWSMGFAAPNSDARNLFLKYSSQSTFNPYNMKGDAAEKLLIELAGKTISMAPSTMNPPRPLGSTAPTSFASTPPRPVAAGATASLTSSQSSAAAGSSQAATSSSMPPPARVATNPSASSGTPLMSGAPNSAFGPFGSK